MRIPRIYTQQPLAENTNIELEEKPSHHLSKVLRFKEGAEIMLFNGAGGQYQATIDSIGKKHLQIALNKYQDIEVESPLSIHLGIAVSKGDRMDWVIQKATELGVHQITPLFSARSEVKLKGERATRKVNHWQQIAISACEQSQRNYVPQVGSISHISDWVKSVEAEKKFVLHHRTDEKLNPAEAITDCAILIGPEGGLDNDEIQQAEENGFQALALGPRVLRTETAPLAAITLLQSVWGDMKT